MDNIIFVECSNEIIEKFRNKKEIFGFKFGCSLDGKTTKTVCVQKSDTEIALLDYSLENTELCINEFEVFLSKRKKNYGREIISCIQKCDEISLIYLYAETSDVKQFWNKCGFQECDDGTGTLMMIWENDTKGKVTF